MLQWFKNLFLSNKIKEKEIIELMQSLVNECVTSLRINNDIVLSMGEDIRQHLVALIMQNGGEITIDKTWLEYAESNQNVKYQLKETGDKVVLTTVIDDE